MNIHTRHQFVLLKVYWEGTVARADLVDEFEISPTQATKDFQQIRKNYRDALIYDPSIRRYCPGITLERYVSEYSFDKYYSFVCKESSTSHLIQIEPRAVDAQIYRTVHQAIKKQFGIEVKYQSLNDPEGGKKRTLYPHTVIRSGFRWHIRAYELQSGQFKDFNLSRIKTIWNLIEETTKAALIDNDSLWNEEVTLVLTPNQLLGEFQRKVVAVDYTGTEDMLIELHVKAAELLYVLHLYEVRDFSDSPPSTQLLQIANTNSIKKYLPT